MKPPYLGYNNLNNRFNKYFRFQTPTVYRKKNITELVQKPEKEGHLENCQQK